jgi:Rrf2 family protein
MRLTKQTGHAIRILIDCAHASGNLVKVADISERLGITKQNVFKIVHILSRTGFVAAVRGPAGGVRLAKSPEKIRVGDVVRAIEVTRVQVDGAEDLDAQSDDRQGLNSVFDNALTAFISVLDQHTLADLAAAEPASLRAPAARKRSTNKRGAQEPARKPKSSSARRA